MYCTIYCRIIGCMSAWLAAVAAHASGISAAAPRAARRELATGRRACLTRAIIAMSAGGQQQPATVDTTNHAFLFIKPHASNDAVATMCRSMLTKAGVSVSKEGVISAERIDQGGLIDKHYGTLAERAMNVQPLDLPVWTAEKREEFTSLFGESHTSAADAGRLLNLRQAMAKLPGVSAAELETRWRDGACLKLAPGTYVARVAGCGFVVNGFCKVAG
jgi:hypothetical protein